MQKGPFPSHPEPQTKKATEAAIGPQRKERIQTSPPCQVSLVMIGQKRLLSDREKPCVCIGKVWQQSARKSALLTCGGCHCAHNSDVVRGHPKFADCTDFQSPQGTKSAIKPERSTQESARSHPVIKEQYKKKREWLIFPLNTWKQLFLQSEIWTTYVPTG